MNNDNNKKSTNYTAGLCFILSNFQSREVMIKNKKKTRFYLRIKNHSDINRYFFLITHINHHGFEVVTTHSKFVFPDP